MSTLQPTLQLLIITIINYYQIMSLSKSALKYLYSYKLSYVAFDGGTQHWKTPFFYILSINFKLFFFQSYNLHQQMSNYFSIRMANFYRSVLYAWYWCHHSFTLYENLRQYNRQYKVVALFLLFFLNAKSIPIKCILCLKY